MGRIQKKYFMAGIILISIGAPIIFYGIFVVYPAYDLEFRQTEPRPVSGVPWNSTLLDDLKQGEAYVVAWSKRPKGSESLQPFVVPYNLSPIQFEVEFGTGASINGIWSGSNAQLVIERSDNVTYLGETHSESWTSSIRGIWGVFSPYLRARVNVGSADYHKWIKAHATLDITYPAMYGYGPKPGEGTFVNEKSSLRLSFEFFVVSHEEYRTLEMHREWEEAYHDKMDEWSIPLVFSGLSIYAGVFILAASVCKRFRDSLEKPSTHAVFATWRIFPGKEYKVDIRERSRRGEGIARIHGLVGSSFLTAHLFSAA